MTTNPFTRARLATEGTDRNLAQQRATTRQLERCPTCNRNKLIKGMSPAAHRHMAILGLSTYWDEDDDDVIDRLGRDAAKNIAAIALLSGCSLGDVFDAIEHDANTTIDKHR